LTKRYSLNPDARDRVVSGEAPFCINRFAAKTLSIQAEYLPKDWPDWTFVPDTVPVVYLFRPKVEGKPLIVDEDAEWIGSLGDIRRWVEADRNRDNFWVSIVLIGLLSIAVVFLRGPEKH
jgi:hypothetical protein